MTADERAVIERAADLVDVSRWAPLDDSERDLVARALADPPESAAA